MPPGIGGQLWVGCVLSLFSTLLLPRQTLVSIERRDSDGDRVADPVPPIREEIMESIQLVPSERLKERIS